MAKKINESINGALRNCKHVCYINLGSVKHVNNKADSTERLVSLRILSDALLQSVMVFESWKKKDSLHQSAPLKSSFSHYLWNKKHRSQDTDLKSLAFKICCSRNVENSLFTWSENVCILPEAFRGTLNCFRFPQPQFVSIVSKTLSKTLFFIFFFILCDGLQTPNSV